VSASWYGIAFDREVECDRGFGLLPRLTIEAKVARFRQINQDRRTSHRDALEFPDGEVVLLTSPFGRPRELSRSRRNIICPRFISSEHSPMAD
jgi:hypothetical protein